MDINSNVYLGNVERGMQLSSDLTPNKCCFIKELNFTHFKREFPHVRSCFKNWHVCGPVSREGDNYGIKNQERGHALDFKTKVLIRQTAFFLIGQIK